MLGVAKDDQRVEAGGSLEHDIAALPPFPVGAAILDEFFVPEADRPWPARARAYENLGPVRENAWRELRARDDE